MEKYGEVASRPRFIVNHQSLFRFSLKLSMIFRQRDVALMRHVMVDAELDQIQQSHWDRAIRGTLLA
jgi:hypothetical protein